MQLSAFRANGHVVAFRVTTYCSLTGFRGWGWRMPRSPRPRRPGTRVGVRAGPAEGDEDRPVPGSGHRTARSSASLPLTPSPRSAPTWPPTPACTRRAHAALRKAVLAANGARPTIIKLAIALAVMLIVAAFAAWAFLPARHLPGNRARHLRIRLHLRLHPGKGFAHAFSLHLRWSRFAVLRRSGRIRPALPLGDRILDPREHSVFLGRAHYRHGLRVPLKSTS